MVLEAGYPGTTGFRKVVKATILVKKKPNMSDADFIEHYNRKYCAYDPFSGHAVAYDETVRQVLIIY